MDYCLCAGPCPICEKGTVEDHLCDLCGAEYCNECHLVVNDYSGIIEECCCDPEIKELDFSDD
jgi:hypothetical protein